MTKDAVNQRLWDLFKKNKRKQMCPMNVEIMDKVLQGEWLKKWKETKTIEHEHGQEVLLVFSQASSELKTSNDFFYRFNLLIEVNLFTSLLQGKCFFSPNVYFVLFEVIYCCCCCRYCCLFPVICWLGHFIPHPFPLLLLFRKEDSAVEAQQQKPLCSVLYV